MGNEDQTPIFDSLDTIINAIGGKTAAGTLSYADSAILVTSATGIDVTGIITTDGLTTSADITFGDNDKAIFGAGSDLSIYHDSASGQSIIHENGPSVLKIRATDFRISNADNTADYLSANNGAEVSIRYNGAVKLATTPTGCDLTGTLTADGLTVESTGEVTGTIRSTSTSGARQATLRLNVASTGGDDPAGKVQFTYGSGYSVAGSIEMSHSNPNMKFATGTTERMRIASNGDISFYEDTGTTAKFFWDASAESLGIGTSPSYTLDVSAASAVSMIRTPDTTSPTLGLFVNSGSNGVGTISVDNGGHMTFDTGSSGAGQAERMRIDSSGNVGIGRTPSSVLLDVQGATSDTFTAARFRNRGQDAGSAVKAIWSLNRDGSDIDFEAGSISVHKQQNWTTTSSTVDSYMVFSTIENENPAERMRIDSGGNVGIGTDAPSAKLEIKDTVTASTDLDPTAIKLYNSSDGGSAIEFSNAVNGKAKLSFGVTSAGGGTDDTYIGFSTSANTVLSEAMRIDSSGSLLHGTTSSSIYNDTSGNGVNIKGQQGQIIVAKQSTSASDPAMILNNTGTDSSIIQFSKDGTTVGSIGTDNSGDLFIGNDDTGVLFAGGSDAILPWNPSTPAARDDAIDLGNASNRFDDIYATNGTIQTSDRNEKQDIAELSDAEQRVAVAAKGLLRKFRWRDAVAEKGDEARTHFGIIAQDLQAAFAAEGLDAGDYAMFISSTWTDEETGEERTRMGVRYSELLAFIIAAI